MTPELTLEEMVDRLDRHRQRATYGAVAGVLGRPATFLMGGIPRSPRYSWVVNKATGEPTGYGADGRHAELYSRKQVIEDADELRGWLASHP